MRAKVAKRLRRAADATPLKAGRDLELRRELLYRELKRDFREFAHPRPAPGPARKVRRPWSEVVKANERRSCGWEREDKPCPEHGSMCWWERNP